MTTVHRQLERASSARVTLLVAPGGCGKSRALAEFLTERPGRRVALFARPEHAEVVRFVRALIDAMPDDVPALRVGFAPAAASARRSARPSFALAGWFAERIGHDARTIVLDDLHHVGTSEAVRGFVVRAIERTGPHVRWILAGRDFSSWPVATWLASSDAANPIEGRDFESPDVRAGETFEDAIVRSVRAWRATRCPSDIAHAVALALLPDLVVERIVALPEGPSLLAMLDETFPFLRSGSRVRHEVLAALADGPPTVERIPEAFEFAKNVLECCGSRRERIELYVATEAHEHLTAALDCDGFDLVDEHFGDVVDAAIESLPPDRRRSCVIALAFEARRETERGRHDLADSWYLQASHRAEGELSKARIDLLLAGALLRRSSYGAVDVFERLATTAAPPAFRAMSLAGLAAGLAAIGSWDRGRACIGEALALLDDTDNVAVRARVLRQAAYVFLRGGFVIEARDRAERAIQLAENFGLDEILAPALSVSMEIASSHADDSEAVVDLLKRLEGCARRLDDAFLLRYARLGLLEAYGDRGAWDEVSRIEAVLARQELENDIIHTDETLLRIRALRAACVGDFAGAHRVLAAAGGLHGDEEQQAFRFSEVALYAAGAGDHAAAARAIDECLAIRKKREQVPDALIVRLDLNLVVATALTHGTVRARSQLDAIAGDAGRYPRLRAFRDALYALLAFHGEDDDSRALLDAFERLHDVRFGGIAALLGELPLTHVLERAS